MPTWGHLGLQDSASPLMEQLIFFHDHAMVVLTISIHHWEAIWQCHPCLIGCHFQSTAAQRA